MNLKNIKQGIANFSKSMWLKSKETFKLPYVKLYIPLTIFLVVIFFIFTFPFDSIIKQQIQKAGSQFSQKTDITDFDFDIIGSSKIGKIVFQFENLSELNLNQINYNFTLNPFTLIISKIIEGTVKINQIVYKNQETEIIGKLDLCDLNLKMDPKFSNVTSGSIKIVFNNVVLRGLKIKGFDIKPLTINQFSTVLKINNKNATISSCQFTGNDLNGSISGNILLGPQLSRSRVNLNIEINKNSNILQDFKPLLSAVSNANSNTISIMIEGNLNNPSVKFPESSNTQLQGN